MSFAVVWTPDAANDIDEVWNWASDVERQSIIEAISAIEKVLQIDPRNAGESREDPSVRIFTVPPVTVRYQFDQRNPLVRVFAARIYRRKG